MALNNRNVTLLARLRRELEKQRNRPAPITKRGTTLRARVVRVLLKKIKAIETTGHMSNWPDMEV